MSYDDVEYRAQSDFDPDERYSAKIEEEPSENEHELDSFESRKLLSKLMEWRSQARIAQAENRREMAIDEDFYDGDQWTAEEIEEIEGRGQPALVYNEIKPAIDWLIGTQKRSRIDWKVLPRRKEEGQEAETKTKLLKYVSDVNNAAFERSEAFSESIKAGLSWLEDGIRGDDSNEPLFSRHETWRNVWYDHLAKAKDMSDSRFLIREKWVDIDIAEATHPDRIHQLRSAEISADLWGEMDEEFYDVTLNSNSRSRRSYINDATSSVENRRPRVRLIECWYREPCACKVVRAGISPQMPQEMQVALGNIKGQEYDETNEIMQSALIDGYASIHDTIKLKVKVAIFVESALLEVMDSPYKHDRFPLTPVWCYRRARDNAPYGIVRGQRDPQADLNKQKSKSQYILSTNQILMETGAVKDKEDLREEGARPDGIIEYNKGFSLEFRKDIVLAREHIMLMQQDGEYIRSVSGVTGENLGRETNATSGIAIEKRQMQGSVTSTEPFDNFRFARQIQGENQLSLVEQFYDEPKVFRITGDRGRKEYPQINSMVEDENGNQKIENDITATKADFLISEQDYRESTRQAMFETMMTMVNNLAQISPDIALSFLDLVFDMSDLPGKDDLVARVRQMTGQSDPSDDTGEAEEKEKAKEQADQQQAKIEQLLQELAMTKEKLEVKKLESEADSARLSVLSSAVEVAERIAHKPDIAAVADNLAESGDIDGAGNQGGELPQV